MSGDIEGAMGGFKAIVKDEKVGGQALLFLGYIHSGELDGYRNLTLSKEYYKLAAEKGETRAVRELGILNVRDGELREARDLFLRCADEYPQCAYEFYLCTKDLGENEELGLQYYDKALALKYPEALAERVRARLASRNPIKKLGGVFGFFEVLIHLFRREIDANKRRPNISGK